jgi:hypothetical protein
MSPCTKRSFVAAVSRERAHRGELALRDVEERRRGAQLCEEDGVPPAATGE